jgi:hypothetical protein
MTTTFLRGAASVGVGGRAGDPQPVARKERVRNERRKIRGDNNFTRMTSREFALCRGAFQA